jgi:hypothetical protein
VPKYGVVCGVWCVVCGVLVSSEAGLCFASCSFVLPLVVCEVAHCCDLPWCGMWYVVCGVVLVSCEAGLRCTSVGLFSTKVTDEQSPLLLRCCPLTWMGDPTTCYNTKAWPSLLSPEAGRCRVSVGVVWRSCGAPLV